MAVRDEETGRWHALTREGFTLCGSVGVMGEMGLSENDPNQSVTCPHCLADPTCIGYVAPEDRQLIMTARGVDGGYHETLIGGRYFRCGLEMPEDAEISTSLSVSCWGCLRGEPRNERTAVPCLFSVYDAHWHLEHPDRPREAYCGGVADTVRHLRAEPTCTACREAARMRAAISATQGRGMCVMGFLSETSHISRDGRPLCGAQLLSAGAPFRGSANCSVCIGINVHRQVQELMEGAEEPDPRARVSLDLDTFLNGVAETLEEISPEAAGQVREDQVREDQDFLTLLEGIACLPGIRGLRMHAVEVTNRGTYVAVCGVEVRRGREYVQATDCPDCRRVLREDRPRLERLAERSRMGNGPPADTVNRLQQRRDEHVFVPEAYDQLKAAEVAYLRANGWVEVRPDSWNHPTLWGGRHDFPQGRAINSQKQWDAAAAKNMARWKPVADHLQVMDEKRNRFERLGKEEGDE